MNYAGLIYDDSRHYIDHLGPFCALLNWPLIICEPAVAELARAYYPDLEVIEASLWNLKLPPCIVSCDTKPLLEAAFPDQKIRFLWLPHGNSDKGWNSPFFEVLGNETIAFVYGQRIVDFMHAKGVFPRISRIGNFRWHYFLKHRAFYDQAIILPQNGKNVLYAPTWDGDCSFWKAFPQLATHFPNDCHLFIKLHPNTIRKYEAELEVFIGRYARQNIIFLPEIPPIYPILSHCDACISDMSSIGYDFLAFDKPLYFFNANQALPLHRCGAGINPESFSFSNTDSFPTLRKAAYNYTFDPIPNWDQLKEQIHALCSV